MEEKKRQRKWIKVLQFLAAYLVAAWTFLQFVDWILIRYSISPYWVDILLWLFVGIIPSLLIYLYHQERINKKILKLREKIIFPLNAVVLALALYFSFGNSDLSATTKTINYENEQGERKTAFITKEEFRSGFSIFNFKSKTNDSTIVWMQWGIPSLLDEDLKQNKNLSPERNFISNTTEKIKNAKLFNTSYVDGEFEIIDSTYTITTFIRNSDDGKIIIEKTFVGTDVLDLIDDITIFVTNNFTTNEFNTPKYIDLNVKEFTSNSIKALKHYFNGDYEAAIQEDGTFALAYLAATKRNLTFNKSKFEEQVLADKAYAYRLKLPIQKQLETLIFKNLAYDQFENAEELVKLQLEVDPSDPAFNSILYNLYGRTKNTKAYTEHAYASYKNKKSIPNGFAMLEASLIKEDYTKVLKELSAIELLQPNNDDIFTLKLVPQLLKGDIKAAAKTQKKIKLIHPDWKNLTKVYDVAIAYLKNHKVSKEALQKFEGEYRNNNSEQTNTFWVKNNTLLSYISNQNIDIHILAGDNLLVEGNALNGTTYKYEFLKNDQNEFYALKMEQNGFSNSYTSWSWKIDAYIKKAESLLEEKMLDSAKIAYKKAIKANPKHHYLNDALAHINYVKSVDSMRLKNQLNEVAGTYGNRNFWVEKGKLFYKRPKLPKIHLLPISDNRYISLTKHATQYGFERTKGDKLASLAYRYNNEDKIWVKLDDDKNYLLKND